MNQKWNVLYYTSEKGECFVEEFIDSRSEKNQEKILAVIEGLESHGPLYYRPYADILEDGIHELRIKLSGDQIRILYFFCYKEFVILTHAFNKTTSEVPKSQIRMAKKIREDFLKRITEQELWRIINEDF